MGLTQGYAWAEEGFPQVLYGQSKFVRIFVL